ncbi:hypothetical protein NliqN6_6698 [Naganishia liquefaciens]|uniref:Uncharacterized protein n=1 Tax=Naganishia liquefaciens TaxID=104408 RepID=A0A8H3YK87_9TREE|nr:hypothetical protein NliqN6_6698 [Naganishia liquefaciens]
MSTGATQAQPIIEVLKELHVIPDVLPSAPDLQGHLTIAYPTHTVQNGEHVERVVTKDTPSIRFKPFGGFTVRPGDGKYSMLMVDPDLTMPNDRLSGQVRHWLQPGITFAEQGDTGEGWVGHMNESAVTEYLECAPGPPGHAHRYVFLLLQESPSSAPQATDFPASQRTAAPSDSKTTENLADRMGMDVAAYLTKKGLQVVGASVMSVKPDVESLVDNAKIGAATLMDKLTGK